MSENTDFKIILESDEAMKKLILQWYLGLFLFFHDF